MSRPGSPHASPGPLDSPATVPGPSPGASGSLRLPHPRLAEMGVCPPVIALPAGPGTRRAAVPGEGWCAMKPCQPEALVPVCLCPVCLASQLLGGRGGHRGRLEAGGGTAAPGPSWPRGPAGPQFPSATGGSCCGGLCPESVGAVRGPLLWWARGLQTAGTALPLSLWSLTAATAPSQPQCHATCPPPAGSPPALHPVGRARVPAARICWGRALAPAQPGPPGGAVAGAGPRLFGAPSPSGVRPGRPGRAWASGPLLSRAPLHPPQGSCPARRRAVACTTAPLSRPFLLALGHLSGLSALRRGPQSLAQGHHHPLGCQEPPHLARPFASHTHNPLRRPPGLGYQPPGAHTPWSATASPRAPAPPAGVWCVSVSGWERRRDVGVRACRTPPCLVPPALGLGPHGLAPSAAARSGHFRRAPEKGGAGGGSVQGCAAPSLRRGPRPQLSRGFWAELSCDESWGAVARWPLPPRHTHSGLGLGLRLCRAARRHQARCGHLPGPGWRRAWGGGGPLAGVAPRGGLTPAARGLPGLSVGLCPRGPQGASSGRASCLPRSVPPCP